MRDIHRSTTTWLARRTGLSSAARPLHRSHRRRLTLEPLEGRALLSLTTWTVNSLGDTGTGSGTSGDLRYCITQADQTPGDNTINFSGTGTITLYSPLPDLSNTTGLMDIEGPGASSLTVARSSALGTPDFGIFTVDANVQAQLAGLTITGGLDGSGGGIDNDGALTVSNSTIANNSATDSYGGPGIGGGIYNAATLIGGRIYNAGALTISNSTIANNSSFSNGVIDFGGGGIFTFGTLTVSNSTIENNSARGTYGSGGGIDDNAGTLTVSNSTIANNSTGGAGGGIFTWFGSGTGALTVSNSTIANNSATGGLGGGMSINEGTATVTNSTIANNSDVGGFGGGIDGSITGVNDTIAYNTATYGGGGLWGDFTLNNSLIALNTSGTGTPDDIAGTVSSASAYNLIGTGGSGGLVNGTNGNQVGVADPGLDPNGLQNNGGPTQTIALLANSPAIDAGSIALAVDPTTGLPLTTDQRGTGFPRIVDNAVDIGAYEFQATTSLVVTTQPPASVTAGSTFGLTVTAEDSSGNVDTSFNGTVTVALAVNPGGGTLGGTLSVTATNGVATFSDLTLNKTGTGYTLVLTGSGLGGSTTAAINVTPAAATQLVVSSQPPTIVAPGSAFGLVVAARDPFGNLDTNFGGSVAVSLLYNPVGATLGGTLSVTAQNGVATFTGLTLNEPGIGYTLTVSSSGLTEATTSAFNVIAPSTWTVNSLGDTGTGSGNSGDLRYVITHADQTTGNNTINFAVTGTITLYSALPDLSNTTGVMDIEGPGASSLTVARSSASGTPDFGIFTVDANVQAQLAGLTITGGSTANGGGIDNGGTLTITSSTIADNSASDYGGGIENEGAPMPTATLTITSSTIADNSAGYGGGGVLNAGTMTVTNSTIADNSGGNGGGGIWTFDTLTLTDSTIADNSAYYYGGGIENAGGTATVTNSTVSGNSAGSGGGIENDGMPTATLTITNSTIANNSAGDEGGGIWNYGGTLTATNSTIAYNSYNSAGSGGGGIGNGFNGAEVGTAMLENTIVALNTYGTGSGAPASDISVADGGTVSSASAYNLIGTGGSGGLVNGTNGNQVGVADPGLDPNGLQNNGGPTQTIALVTGSPAIDAGSASIPGVTVPATDQRGALRGPAGLNAGTTIDIGAYEASSSYLVTSTADTTDVGTLRAAVGWANVSTNANPANVASPAPNTVIFDTAGTFATPQTITLTQGTLELSNTATPESIAGTGVANLTVARSSAAGTFDFGIFTVDSGADVKLVGLTITGGLSDFAGGGVDNAGTLTVIDSSVIDNGVQGVQGVFVGGGGIYNAGKLTVANSNIANNTASPSAYVTAFVVGGGIFNDGTATVTDSTIMGNRTGSDGGGILNEGTLTVTNSTIAQNYAGLLGVGNFTPDPGGGIFSDGTMTVASSTIANNGSAISNASTGGNATVTNSTMVYNGDGIDNSYGGTVTVTDSTIANSQVGLNNGGGLVSGGTLTVTNTTLSARQVSALARS